MQRKVTCLWNEPRAAAPYRTGVSLHSHTNHSKEGLYFILDYARRWPLRQALAIGEKKAQQIRGIRIDFRKAYWTPPLPPIAAFEVETNQIERTVSLNSMVSITDHDNIEAPMLLRVVPKARRTPVSLEWTVPFGAGVFHLGVHNLPGGQAESIMQSLAEYTSNPAESRLAELLNALHENRDVLVILNHPMWDLAKIGAEQHETNLRTFLCRYGQFLHALELSGIRSWQENQYVVHLSEACNQLVISGGDRHGREPNAALNLTNAESFTEFVHEVRKERFSHILFMPQYKEPYTLRILQSLLDIIRENLDDSMGPRHWDERVFHQDIAGAYRPLRALWERPPIYIRYFFAAVRLLEMAPVRKFVQFALTRPEPRGSYAFESRQEAAS